MAPGELSEDVSFFDVYIGEASSVPAACTKKPQAHAQHGEEGGAEKKREYLQSRDLPVHAGMYQIRTDEHGTGVVGKSQEILCFPATDLSAGIEIGSKFGSHGITTEQPKKNGISSGRRNTEDFLPDGFHGG